MRLLAAAVIAVLALAVAPVVRGAVDCVPSVTGLTAAKRAVSGDLPEASLYRAMLIGTAQTVSNPDASGWATVKLRVEVVFRGLQEPEAEFAYTPSPGGRGLRFVAGERYFVALISDGSSRLLTTHKCTPTMAINVGEASSLLALDPEAHVFVTPRPQPLLFSDQPAIVLFACALLVLALGVTVTFIRRRRMRGTASG